MQQGLCVVRLDAQQQHSAFRDGVGVRFAAGSRCGYDAFDIRVCV
jgi:hypothetical protein